MTYRRTLRRLILASLPGSLLFISHVRAETSPLPTPLGAETVIFSAPDAPKGAVILLPGGEGLLGIGPDGSIRYADNFLIRTRDMWKASGFAYAIPDAPAAAPNLMGRRHTPAYSDAVAVIVRALGERYPGVPVWLVGTSQGSIAAANASVALGASVAGVVLTSSVAADGDSGEKVSDVPLAMIRRPVLVVINTKDGCRSSPPSSGQEMLKALTGASPAELMTFTSSDSEGGPCGPKSPHGFLGIETPVISAVTAWMQKNSPPR